MTMLASHKSDLDPASFHTIAELAYRESGLTLVREKSSMICSRLRHRLRALNMADFKSYIQLLKSDAGEAELDASIMDGSTKACGAVAGTTIVKNPISLARSVMTETRHVLLAAAGADAFPQEKTQPIVLV